MRNYLLIFLFILQGFTLPAQRTDTWTAFWNKDTTLLGFKDKNGIVKIKPRFTDLTIARKFDDIMAVTEDKDDVLKSYYLTKSGRVVGKDSLYSFDNGPDCESEGFIRFRDSKTHKMGMFDKKGNVAIPAAYNNLTRVRNGLIIALKGARWDEKTRSESIEFPWVGGKEILINTKNKTVIDGFNTDNKLNFYSLLISTNPNPDTIRQNFKALNGLYYSFINFDKEFASWLKISLLNNFTLSNLLNSSYSQITVWKEPKGWASEPKKNFITRNYKLIKTKLLQLNSKNCDYTIFDDAPGPYIYETGECKNFFNNCGEAKDWIYPVKDIVISYKVRNGLLQDHLEFLRTNKGYKLISVTIRKGQLK